MEHSKLLTVVIPIYNRAHIVERTLDSIAHQTFSDFSLIIVDNGSTDNSVEIAQKWIQRNAGKIDARLLSEPKQGAAAARNRGLKETNTPYVMFFNDVDEMRPNHIERFISEINSNPEVEIVRWPVSFIDPDGWIDTHDKHFHDELQLNLLHSTLSTQRYGVRTDLIRAVGGWNENLSTWDDLELGIRLLMRSPKLVKINGEPTVAIHLSAAESTTAESYLPKAKESERALSAIRQLLSEADMQQEVFLTDCRRAILAAHYRREGDATAAKKLLATAKQAKSPKQKLILNIIYLTTRLSGRSGSAAALFLAGKKRERR